MHRNEQLRTLLFSILSFLYVDVDAILGDDESFQVRHGVSMVLTVPGIPTPR